MARAFTPYDHVFFRFERTQCARQFDGSAQRRSIPHLIRYILKAPKKTRLVHSFLCAHPDVFPQQLWNWASASGIRTESARISVAATHHRDCHTVLPAGPALGKIPHCERHLGCMATRSHHGGFPGHTALFRTFSGVNPRPESGATRANVAPLCPKGQFRWPSATRLRIAQTDRQAIGHSALDNAGQ